MSEPANNCPKCHSDRTELKGGLIYCPNCGFEGEEKKPDAAANSGSSVRKFWILLISPAAVALLSFALGQISSNLRNAGAAVGAVDLLIGLGASIYCGVWLARRFFTSSSGLRPVFSLIFVFGIGIINFFIICVGCTSNYVPPLIR
jgi:hypothetical protein